MGTCAQLGLALMTTVLTTSCVVPIPASPSIDGDAGSNGLPDIIGASPASFAFPGPNELTRGARDQITITLKDMDLDDTLTLRVFRNYPSSLAPIGETTGTSIGGGQRLATLDTTSWCVGAPDNQQIIFTFIVADRPFDEDSTKPPEFQAVTPGGNASTSFWIGICRPAS